MTENRVTLTGFASLPADTFAEGSETGADIDTTRTGPFPGQPVGGWSGVQFADKDSYWFIVDSLFGGNSDTLARIYQVDPNFAGIEGGDGSVEIENFITLGDPNNLVPFEIRNENDPERPLTGTDFDTEALVIDSNGNLWVGDEYGPYLLHFDREGTLLEAPIDTPNIPQLNTLNGQEPINIGHRGASGPLPEHTLAGFQLALEQGADFIETDYVMTSDGVPIVRHEPLLENTTDILDRPEFSDLGEAEPLRDRETTKTIDGVEYTGFFAEDFTLAEIKTLRARQPRPERSDEFDDLYEIPTMAEVIQLVKDYEASTGQQVGIVHELKHNSYFDSIGLNVEEATVRVLVEEDFTNPEQNIIQTFEIAPLISLDKEIMPEAGIDVPLHQLTGAFSEEFSPGFSFPYDIIANFSNPDFTEEDARAVYGELVDIIDLGVDTGYGDLLALPEVYQFMSTYAEAVNPWKNTILLRELLEEPVDGDGDGNAEISTQLTGEVFPLIEYAHDAGLLVNVYTLRDEERYLTLNPDGTVQTPQEEAEDLIRLGADGLIGDFPETIETVLDAVLADEVRSPQNPEVEAGEEVVNLRGSRGFEGIGYSPDRTTLYPILEAPVDGDPENSLRIYEYDIETGTYSDELVGLYPLSDSGDTPTFQLGDLTPINDTEFLAIERDDFQAEEAFLKKIFKIDISQVDENGFVQKTELVDLLNIADPEDLNNDGDTDFTLPITSVEDVLAIDEKTVLVSVDNNYPFGDFATGRPPELDDNEIILLELPEPLDLDPRLGVAGLDFNPLEGSLDEYIGFENGSYFIEVPDGEINEFFNWNEQYPQLVSAHRGGFLPGFPENAIATFANTLTTAPALLEVDVRRTADGEWILMHDDDLDRTTNGTGLVEETTLAEIQTLQLVDKDGNLTPYKVPTLQEAILWAEGKTILELDIKSDDFTGEVAEIITELDGEDQVRFITQDIEQATEVYNINPEIHLGLFIIPENQESVFADVAAAPFTLDSVSAFTGTQPQPAEFYQSLHDEGIVAIQGLFGDQDTFDGESIDDLSEEQRDTLFTTVFDNGADAIAADYYQQIAGIIGYPVADTVVNNIEFLGEVTFETGFIYEGTEVGGISGITYDPGTNLYYGLSDDRGNRAEPAEGASFDEPARYYDIAIDLSDGSLDEGDVTFTEFTTLSNVGGSPFNGGAIDPEGIALAENGNLYISSEGDADNLINPFVAEFTAEGQIFDNLPVPEKFLPTADQSSGIQNNQAFEGLTITPDNQFLYTATEGALFQDEESSSLESVSPSRIIQYNLSTQEPIAEFAYLTDAVAETPEPDDSYGLVELLAVDDEGTLLAMERSFVSGIGNNIRIYEIDTQDATDVSDIESLADADIAELAIEKRLVADLEADFGIEEDNVEALTFGGTLPDGSQSLIAVSDNNFNSNGQLTQFLAFSLDIDEPETKPDIIDLTTFTAEISAVNDAGFDNIGGFYQAIDAEGTVIDPLSGNEVNVGDMGYEDAALANSVVQLRDGENANIELNGSMVYVPYLLANGTRFFTAYEEANPDGIDHVMSQGDNTFGFEDLLGGGDNDFNDFVISFDIA